MRDCCCLYLPKEVKCKHFSHPIESIQIFLHARFEFIFPLKTRVDILEKKTLQKSGWVCLINYQSISKLFISYLYTHPSLTLTLFHIGWDPRTSQIAQTNLFLFPQWKCFYIKLIRFSFCAQYTNGKIIIRLFFI